MKKTARSKTSIKIISLLGIALFTIGVVSYVNSKNICANSISCIKDLTGEYEENALVGEYLGSNVSAASFAKDLFQSSVLGENTSSNKNIEIDLTNQKLYALEDGARIYEFPISSGKWAETPVGEFRTWIKLRYTRMTGGVKGTSTYYNLPNVPYTMYFYNEDIPKWRGYGIHGAYWHNNFGHPMSHGCVNMRIEDAGKLFYWANPPLGEKSVAYASDELPGTRVVIYGNTPAE